MGTIANWYVVPNGALVLLVVGFVCNSGIRLFQIKDEQREEERKAQEVELNNHESLIYKVRRVDVVKQNQPLLNKLSSLLELIESAGQFASLDDTKSKIEELQKEVSIFQPFYDIYILRFFVEPPHLPHATAVF